MARTYNLDFSINSYEFHLGKLPVARRFFRLIYFKAIGQALSVRIIAENIFVAHGSFELAKETWKEKWKKMNAKDHRRRNGSSNRSHTLTHRVIARPCLRTH